MVENKNIQSVASGQRLVLIVEDNELNREMLCAMLEDRYRILQAENGREGLDLLQQYCHEISLVVLDVQMPVMNGYEFLHEVQNDDLLSKIPVIVATGSTNQNEEEKCLTMGATDFVTKPYNRKIVLSRISNIIKLRESVSTLSEIEFDELTGVFTRQSFMHYADAALRQHPEVDYSLVISEMEDLHLIEERSGRPAAEAIIKQNVKMLLSRQVPGCIYGRYSDTQFVSMFVHQDRYESGEERVFGNTKISGAGHNVCTLKFGIKQHLDHSVSIKTHCTHALTALNSVSHRYGKPFAVFTDSMLVTLQRQASIEQCMEEALEKEQFRIYYQPKHDARTGKLVGAEALIRWVHPEFGFMSPAEFIPVFEHTGFVVEADHYAWCRTCYNQRRWQDLGLPVVPISVNCSRLGFLLPDFCQRLMRPVQQYSLDPRLLHLEVTESLFIDQVKEMSEVLSRCRELGFEIELDDFGTGYSSLNTLQLLPLDMVKFDMSFIRMMDQPKMSRVMEACVTLLQNLQLQTTAEGVETSAQLQKLRNMGIDVIQGYYMSKPLPESEFEEYLLRDHSF